MIRTWLVLDVSCLAYRAFYAIGKLDWEGVGTGVVFGIFRDVLDLWDLFTPTGVAFCFDGGCDKRIGVDVDYKGSRREIADEEKEARRELRRQLYRLRTKYLQALGFHTILFQEGYEADDLIASVCENLPSGEQAVVVSTDHDMFQLLVDDRVTIWNPIKKKSMTAKSFQKEWGIGPSMWADVLAIAGCPGDGVVGIRGIGEKTAVKFLTGNLKETVKAYDKVVKGNDVWKRNLELVRLPFPGVKRVELQEDRIDRARWRHMLKGLGMSSLVGRV